MTNFRGISRKIERSVLGCLSLGLLALVWASDALAFGPAPASSRAQIEVGTGYVTGGDGVISSPPQSPPPLVRVQLDRVYRVQFVAPAPTDCINGKMCPELAPIGKWLISGIVRGPKNSAGVYQDLKTEVDFIELYSQCAETAKRALLNNGRLSIAGHGSSVVSSQGERKDSFFDISSCVQN
jgi:hypothetical protein